MSQVRQRQRPSVGNGHYQQSCTPSGLLGNSLYPLARLLITLIGALNIGIVARQTLLVSCLHRRAPPDHSDLRRALFAGVTSHKRNACARISA